MRPTRRHLRATGCRWHVSLFGLAPEGVYRAAAVTGDAVRSYRTLSPLPVAGTSSNDIGGLLSVALSVGSRRPGVTWPLALWSPDFPRSPRGNRDRLADSAIDSKPRHRWPQATYFSAITRARW